MDMEKILFAIGILLMMLTTALEFRGWWNSTDSPSLRRRYGVIGLMNVVGIMLILISKF